MVMLKKENRNASDTFRDIPFATEGSCGLEKELPFWPAPTSPAQSPPGPRQKGPRVTP